MTKLQLVLIGILTFVTFREGYGSKGAPYVTNFSYNKQLHNQIWSIEQTGLGSIVIASKSGLLEFDSEEFSRIETPDLPYKLLQSKSSEMLFVAGRGYIGGLTRQDFGMYSFVNFDVPDIYNQYYKEIIETDSTVFFLSRNSLVGVNKKDPAIYTQWLADSGRLFTGMFSYNSQLFVNVFNEGIYIVDEYELSITDQKFEHLFNKEIVFETSLNDSVKLIGTSDGNLVLFDGATTRNYQVEDDSFIQTGILTGGLVLNESIYLSTQNYGVLIVDKKTGQTQSILNYTANLPTNHITSLKADIAGGVWLAHGFGLSRIDTKLPLTNYGIYRGLNASILTVRPWNNLLYVATTDGVYALDTIKSYDTQKATKRIKLEAPKPIIDKKEIAAELSTSMVAKENEPTTEENIVTDEKAKKRTKKRFLKRIFSKEDKDSEHNNKTTELKEEKPVAKMVKVEPEVLKPQFQYFSYDKVVLKSKEYGYSRLDIINSRCKKLIATENALLAVTDANLYSINTDNVVEEIFASSQIYKVTVSHFCENCIYIVTNEGLVIGENFNGFWTFDLLLESNINYKLTEIVELNDNELLLSVNNQLIHYNYDTDTENDIDLYNPYSEYVNLMRIGEQIYAVAGNYFFTVHRDSSSVVKLQQSTAFNVSSIFDGHHNQFWIRNINGGYKYFGLDTISNYVHPALNIFGAVNDIFVDSDRNLWIVDEFKDIYRLNAKSFESYQPNVKLWIKYIKSYDGKLVLFDKMKLKYSDNSLVFSVYSPSYLKFQSNEYQYTIDGLMNEWSEWSGDNDISVPYLPPGRYTFRVKGRDIFNNESAVASINFKISPPFYRTLYFYLLCTLLLLAMVYYTQQLRMKKLVRDKKILRDKVKERTIELEEKNIAITDSINYGSRIQEALLPSIEVMQEQLEDYFLIYRPKDIVSGDFYWVTHRKDITIIAAADCTGHGVPGAFLSMLGMAYLDDIFRKSDVNIPPGDVLDILRKKIVKIFEQHSKHTRDGLDIALVMLNRKTRTIRFSGAHNPLYLFGSKSNEIDESMKKMVVIENEKHRLIQCKGDRFQVGYSNKMHRSFTNYEITYHPGDTFYIFSDGYTDQFGGEEYRKFMYGPFKRLLLKIQDKSMDEQRQELIKATDAWRNGDEQTDDMLVLGVKL
ncbi:MAG: SpoIIE family protein phosphatase [Bacteroidales bacterium]|nr:SpoIIE family protein phosphatase [Bacteroidales bacterium]